MRFTLQTLFFAILGVVQGLAEFLPISSSGHLIVAEKLLAQIGYHAAGGGAGMLNSILLHAGTLIAVIVVFWDDWLQILKNPFKSKTLLLLFIASLPALGVKLVLGETLDAFFEGWFLGVSFLITGCMLVVIDVIRSRRSKHVSGRDEVTTFRAVIMGLFQGVALLPGVSRSGSTILGGVSTGLSAKSAAKFSFMMSAPAIVGSLLAEILDIVKGGQVVYFQPVNAIVGVVCAAFSGYLAIRYMLKLISRVAFRRFAVYVFLIGAAVLACQLTDTLGFPPVTPPLG